jgi:hypothetical protein
LHIDEQCWIAKSEATHGSFLNTNVCIKWCTQNTYIKMKFDVFGCRLRKAEKAKKKNDNNNEIIKQKCNISKMMVQHNTMMNSKCHCLSGC